MSIQDTSRNCLICNQNFRPRLYQIKIGHGKYCSIKCRSAGILPALLSKESKQKSKETYIKNMNLGLISHPKGELHPRWKGGEKATIAESIKNGKRNESVKKYRAKNPDKLREWSSTRAKRKTGRLPRGTVKSIGDLQGWLCVYCKINVSDKYHVDHIYPLSKGGRHEPSNLQILCQPCNLKKSSKII